MHLTRGMWEAMTAVGYKEKKKYLSRHQVQTIVSFLGEPGGWGKGSLQLRLWGALFH